MTKYFENLLRDTILFLLSIVREIFILGSLELVFTLFLRQTLFARSLPQSKKLLRAQFPSDPEDTCRAVAVRAVLLKSFLVTHASPDCHTIVNRTSN